MFSSLWSHKTKKHFHWFWTTDRSEVNVTQADTWRNRYENVMQRKDEVMYCTVEVWEWMCDPIPHFTGHVITYPCWDSSYIILVKEVNEVYADLTGILAAATKRLSHKTNFQIQWRYHRRIMWIMSSTLLRSLNSWLSSCTLVRIEYLINNLMDLVGL